MRAVNWKVASTIGYGLAVVFSVLLIVTAVAPMFPVNWWWVRFGDFPRLQLLAVYAVTLSLLLGFGGTNLTRWLAAGLGLCCVIQVYWIFPYLPIAPKSVQAATSNDPASRLRILGANVLQSNTDAEPLLKLVAREQPDLLVLCEVSRRWMRDLEPLDRQFRHAKKHPLENGYGIAMYTNLAVESWQVRGMVKDDIPSIDARLIMKNGQPLRVFAVHPNPPRPGEGTVKRDAELVLVGRAVVDDPTVIVMGDMNDVGWSRTTNLFQEVSQLLDPRMGRGLYATFSAESWFMRYPLDYLFHSSDFRVGRLERMEYIGSDHFPLFVELSHEPAAAAVQEAPDLDAGDREDAQETIEALEKPGAMKGPDDK